MRKEAILSLLAVSVIWVPALSCRGKFEYDLNSKAEPERRQLPPRSSTLREALGEVVLPLLAEHDTEYAPRFDERLFRSLPIGTTQAEAKRRLGEPLFRESFPDGSAGWYYSRHGKKSKSYLLRLLEFNGQGFLVARSAEFVLD